MVKSKKPRSEDMASTHQQVAERDTKRRLKSLASAKPLKHGGPVAEAVRQAIIDGEKTYEEVAEEVRREVPGARTTARSVASVVRALRRDGYRVPDRRHAQAH